MITSSYVLTLTYTEEKRISPKVWQSNVSIASNSIEFNLMYIAPNHNNRHLFQRKMISNKLINFVYLS